MYRPDYFVADMTSLSNQMTTIKQIFFFDRRWRKRALIAALIWFFSCLLYTAPAALFAQLLRVALPPLQLQNVSGSFWNGSAAQAFWFQNAGQQNNQAIALGSFEWHLRPWSLLWLHPSVHIAANYGEQFVDARVRISPLGNITLTQTSAALPAALLSSWAPVAARGQLALKLERAELSRAQVRAVQGTLYWQQAQWQWSSRWLALGDYRCELTMPASQQIHCAVQGQGALALDGAVDVNANERSWAVQLQLKAEPSSARGFSSGIAVDVGGAARCAGQVVRQTQWALVIMLRAVLTCVLMVVCIAVSSAHAEWYSDKRAIMGTAVSVELWADDANTAQAAIDAVMQEMTRIDQTMSPYIDTSELALINREAAQHPVKISAEMLHLLKTSLHYSRVSHGAFDISFASVGYMYDYRNHIQPSDAQIASHLTAIDYRSIKLDEKASTVHFLKPGMRIDFGGIAKGYAVDQGADILSARGITSAIVTAGGDSRIVGDHRGRPWMIGIKNPRAEDKSAVVLPLADTAISTSGDYERYFMDGERRVHHIINPKTGKSATGVRSVSVLAPHGIDTDALTKPLFILGVQRGMEIIDTIPGVDAIVIDDQGQLFYSKNLAPPAK